MADPAERADASARGPTLGDDPETLAMMGRIEAHLFDASDTPVLIGRFALQRILGAGGMGVVHLAHDDVLDRHVAIKLIRSERAPSAQGRARLLREARAMARVSHANVVQVYEAGEHAQRVFVAMEYVEGQTLERWLHDDGRPRSWSELLRVLVAAGRGLAAAHDAGVVHRDFKPENVLMTVAGEPKVGDFGLAGLEGPFAAPTTTSETHLDALTSTGSIMGTPLYMAPEQFAGCTADARSDQFAFCVVAYEALLGQRPFAGETLAALEANVAAGALRPAPRHSRVPRWLIAVIERGLAVDPAHRWPSMDALLAAMSPRRRRGMVGAAVVLATAFAGLWAWQSHVAAGSRCEQGRSELVDIWGPARRDATEATMRASGLAHAEDTFARVAPVLDDYAAAWTDAFFGACRAQEGGEREADTRMACLEHARQELRIVSDDLVIGQPDTVQHAVDLVATLPEIDRCADPERAALDVGSLHDPEIRALIDGLAHAKVLVESRRLADADARLVELQAQALAHERDALEARTLLLRSRTAFLGSANDDAHRHASAALALAERAAHDDIALDAWRRLAAASRRGGELERAAFELDRADALASRRGTEAEVLADLHFDRASVLAAQGRHEQAAAEYDAALAGFRALSPEHPRIGDVLADMGVSLLMIGKQEQAIASVEQSVEVKSRRLGAFHPALKIALTSAANHYMAAGRFEDALRLHRRALAIAELYPEDHPNYIVVLAAFVGQDLVAMRRFEEAADVLEHAAAVAEERTPTNTEALGHVAMARGNLELDRRRYAAAIPHYERVLSLSSDETWANRSIALVNLALALAREGRIEEALARAAEARTATARLPRDSPIVAGLECYAAEVDRLAGRTVEARAGFARALAALDGSEAPAELRFIAHFGAARVEPDAGEARTHAEHAAAVLEELPVATFERAELAEWLTTRGLATKASSR